MRARRTRAALAKTPKRQALPGQLERIEHRYEIEPAQCALGHALKRIGEEISEQLDCVPTQFFVHRHIRGKYTCACCQTILAAAMPAQIIDKGIPAPGLLAQVIIAKHDDHFKAFEGVVVVDDYAGYKALFTDKIKEAGCWAHVRRKFFEAHKHTQSPIAHEALEKIQALYAIEREAKELTPDERLQLRQDKSIALLSDFKAWLMRQRPELANSQATAKAMDYTLRRWPALTIHTTDGRIPIDNNAVENAIRPLTLGRKNWLFVGSEQAGERAANLMGLIESAKLNGHDAWAYLKDILTKLPTWPNSRIHELLPHNWIAPNT